ncbi:MAG: YihY/virulence factor BrkB family protein [Candidatus Bathyarchaeia archaeon]|jgi:membrane protein
MNKKELIHIFKETFNEWRRENITLRAAALTFFIILPLPTLLLIVVALFTVFFGEQQAIQLLLQQITAVAGPAVAELFREILGVAELPLTSIFETFFTVAFTIVGAIGAFSILADTIDAIWEVKKPQKQPLLKVLRQKIGPFLFVSSLGLIVIVWTSIASVLFNVIAVSAVAGQTITLIALSFTQILLSFGITTLIFAIIYKRLPIAKVHWRDVTLPSIVAGAAFTATNYIFGFYIQTFTITTIAGAAGSLIILLLWIFILNQIVLFGAEISKTYAVTVGSHSSKHQPTNPSSQTPQKPHSPKEQGDVELTITFRKQVKKEDAKQVDETESVKKD